MPLNKKHKTAEKKAPEQEELSQKNKYSRDLSKRNPEGETNINLLKA